MGCVELAEASGHLGIDLLDTAPEQAAAQIEVGFRAEGPSRLSQGAGRLSQRNNATPRQQGGNRLQQLLRCGSFQQSGQGELEQLAGAVGLAFG